MEKTSMKSVQATDEKEAVKNPEMDYFSNFDFKKLEEVSLEAMFKAGVHFGHHKSRINPKMKEYIFTTKNSINIFNLEKTKEKLEEAINFIIKTISENKEILFVGTRKQAKKIVESAAKKCEMPYVTERWLGGTFTNYSVISGRTRYLREGLEKLKNGEYTKYTKFEQMKKVEELEKLEHKMGGIKNMAKLPGAIFVTSVIEDCIAIQEARNKNIPVIALVDSNINPKDIEYVIPANEDALSSLRIMVGYITKAVLDGKEKMVKANITKE